MKEPATVLAMTPRALEHTHAGAFCLHFRFMSDAPRKQKAVSLSLCVARVLIHFSLFGAVKINPYRTQWRQPAAGAFGRKYISFVLVV